MSETCDGARPGMMPDLSGRRYYKVLEQLHRMLLPRSYLEIGVRDGRSFALSRCASIGVDPRFTISDPSILKEVLNKPSIMFFTLESDKFFEQFDPSQLLGGPVDFAFLDGLHQCEFLLRDFMNTEACCMPTSVIALHDCLPVETAITGRVIGERRSALPERFDWWAGDVWRTSLLLKRHRPDLRMTALDAPPTGLVLITNLSPTSTTLSEGYDKYVEEMLSWSLDDIGISALFNEMQVESTSAIETNDRLKSRFCFDTNNK
jgi:hypothetical protein